MASDDNDRMREAIERLYGVFSAYKLHEHVAGCTHCVSDRDHARIHRAPLRELTGDDLERYAFKAMTTWGTANDFRHFLPRIFELIARDPWDPIVAEVAVGKLSEGKWTSWPSEEQVAIREFLHAWWLETLSQFPLTIFFDADKCLCCIGQAVDDLGDFLNEWRIDSIRAHALHFAEFIQSNGAVRPERKRRLLASAFWHNRPQSEASVIRWLTHPARAEEVERAFSKFEAGNEDEAAMLSCSLGYLSTICAAAGGTA